MKGEKVKSDQEPKSTLTDLRPLVPLKKFPPNFRIHKKSFVARTSTLDAESILDGKNPFAGFFVLFWMVMAFYCASTIYVNYKHEGVAFKMYFYSLFSQHALNLAIADLTMIASTYSVLLIMKTLNAGWMSYNVSWVVQHVYQTIWFFSCLTFIITRHWPWVQTGFFVLHSISMLMKQHAYLEYNRELYLKSLHMAHLKVLIGEAKRKAENATEADTVTESLGNELLELQTELFPYENHRFPDNLTFANYTDYLLVPTLVYELYYPRTNKVRPWYLLYKTVGTLFSFTIMYLVVEEYIMPLLNSMDKEPLLVIMAQLLAPFILMYLLIFYIIFECILNGFAEFTRFADRHFYDDWWNSRNWDEYARKWNRPVHEFLLRHVYLESIRSYKVSPQSASLLTFILSACFHELVMAIIGKKVRMYLFLLQMSQLVLVYVGKLSFIKKYPVVGNVIYWFGMIVGTPLLAIFYCSEHYGFHSWT